MGVQNFPQARYLGPPQTLQYAEVTAQQLGITTETDLTGLAVTVYIPSGRRIQITARIAVNGTVASNTAALQIREGATLLQNIQIQNSTTAGNGTTQQGSVVLTPTAGTHTYKLTLQMSAGTGSVGMYAAAGVPAFILVEDITGGDFGTSSTQNGIQIVTSSSRPSFPVNGLQIYETDTTRGYTWNGTSWANPAGDTGWITPTLINSWVNYDSNTYSVAKYRKIGDVVYVSGLVKSGTTPGDVFILPVGYRPARNLHFATPSNGAFGIVEICVIAGTAGAVKANTGSNVWFSLECCFPVP